MPCINISVKFTWRSYTFDGVTLHPGVSLDLTDAPCGPARQMLVFDGAPAAPTGIFFDAVTSIDVDAPPVPHYLQLRAASTEE